MSRFRDLLRWFNQDDHHKGLRLAVLAFLVLGSGLGLRDPWPPDEPALGLMMRDMALSGEWLIPYLSGQPFSDHPPFAIWIGAAFFSVTGSLRLAFLLPSLLAAFGTLWLVFDLGRRLWGARAGRLAAITLLCCFQFLLQSHSGQVDAVFCFWTTLALYALMRYLLLEHSPRWLVTAGAAIGFGMLTKGAGYIALLVLLPWLWMRAHHWDTLPERGELRALWPLPLTAFGVVMAWALPALAFVSGADDAALDKFRAALTINLLGGADLLLGGPQQPLWYLPLQALGLWLPITLLLPWLLPIWRQRLRDHDPRTSLLLGFIIAVGLFFTILPGRHGVQIYPALPALALLAGANLGGTWWRPGVQWLSRGTLTVVGLLLCITVMRAWLQPEQFGLRLPPDTPFGMFWVVGLLGVLALVLAVAFGIRSRHQALSLPVFIGIGWLVVGWAVYPWLNGVRTPDPLMRDAEAYLRQLEPATELRQWRIGMLDWRPQFALATDIPIAALQIEQPLLAARKHCAAEGPRAVLGSLAHLHELQAAGLTIDLPLPLGVRHRREWGLGVCVES